MNIIERNISTMKQFETMINTADENLAEKLISEKASFIHQLPQNHYTVEKVIYLWCFG